MASPKGQLLKTLFANDHIDVQNVFELYRDLRRIQKELPMGQEIDALSHLFLNQANFFSRTLPSVTLKASVTIVDYFLRHDIDLALMGIETLYESCKPSVTTGPDGKSQEQLGGLKKTSGPGAHGEDPGHPISETTMALNQAQSVCSTPDGSSDAASIATERGYFDQRSTYLRRASPGSPQDQDDLPSSSPVRQPASSANPPLFDWWLDLRNEPGKRLVRLPRFY